MNAHLLCVLLALSLCMKGIELSSTNTYVPGICKSQCKKYLYHSKYLGSHISYYPNSSATFQLRLLLAGDINPNPGPSVDTPGLSASSQHRKRYSISDLLDVRISCSKLPIPLNAWKTIKNLRINSKHPTHRGRTKRQFATQYSARCRVLASTETTDVAPLICHHPTPITKPSKTSLEVEHTKSNKRSIEKCRFALWNARSLRNKTTSIIDLIIGNDLDILAICESWLHGDDRDNHTIADLKTALPDFDLHQVPRHTRGGGVCVMLRQSFIVKINVTEKYSSFEYIDLSVQLKSSVLRMIVVYRPPYSAKSNCRISVFIDEFSTLMETVTTSSVNFLIAGDFNLHVDDPTNRDGKKMRDLINSFDLHQHVNESTHSHGHTLDLIMTRKAAPDVISNVAILRGLPSDHHAIQCEIDIARPAATQDKISFRKLQSIDINQFEDDISQSALYVNRCRDINLVDQYNSILSGLLDTHAPMIDKNITRRSNNPSWYNNNDALHEMKRKKRCLERKFFKSGLTIDKQIYKEYCKLYKNELESAKSEYFTEQLQNSDGKTLFRIVKSLSDPNTSKVLPDHTCSTSLANDFAQFFDTKIQHICADLNATSSPPLTVELQSQQTELKFDFSEVSEETVRKIIMGSPSKTCALDPIPTPLLKKCINVLVPVITEIVNKSLSSGVMPESLKLSHVTPILKKTSLNPNILQNYRPVSQIPFLAKVIERCACTQLQYYFETNKLYASTQSAYRSNFSTETALLKVQNDLLRATDEHKETLMVLLDFSAAFDTIDHALFLERLHSRYGLTETVVAWFSSYLKDRKQSVVIDNCTSECHTLNCGVPQGSVIGAPAFTFYTSPISDIISAHHLNHMMYADDIQIYIDFKPSETLSAIQRLEACVADVKSWATNNKLKFNDSKTEILHISSRFQTCNPTPPIKIGDLYVKPVEKARNLGVIFSKHLQMTDQIGKVIRAGWAGVHKIGRLRKYLDQPTSEKLVHAFITSHIDYCNSLLTGSPDTDVSRLQRLQNASARIITRTKRHDHISPILHNLHWLPVHLRIRFKLLLLMYKCMNGQAPSYLQEHVIPYTPTRQLRSATHNLVVQPKVLSRSYGERSFSFIGPSLWNALPNRIKNSPSVDSFKINLKSYLFQEHFQS